MLFLDTPNSIHEKNRVIDHSGFPTWAIIVASFLKIGRRRITNSRQEGVCVNNFVSAKHELKS